MQLVFWYTDLTWYTWLINVIESDPFEYSKGRVTVDWGRDR